MKRYEFGLQKVLDYDKFIQKIEADAMNTLQAEYLDIKRRERLNQLRLQDAVGSTAPSLSSS